MKPTAFFARSAGHAKLYVTSGDLPMVILNLLHQEIGISNLVKYLHQKMGSRK